MEPSMLKIAIERYAQSNASIGGRPASVTLQENFDQYVAWSRNVWEDGVPVTKMFSRNDEIPLFIPKGTTLEGITYTGMVTGMLIFDFYHGNTWYSYVGAEHLFNA